MITRYEQCQLATMSTAAEPYGLIPDGAVVVEDGQVVWVGERGAVPGGYREIPVTRLAGRLVTPGLIDCHTHLVFGGHRALEFEQRLAGASYESIARSGGGIAGTVAATRSADDQTLVREALARLDLLISQGVAAVEIKTGYGLTIDDEIRMLRIARLLGQRRPVLVKTTWLAAHAVPPEYAGQSDRYLEEVVMAGLELAVAEGLVDAVDGYCESIAFSPAQIARVFDLARSLQLPVKLHAEQLSNQGGAEMAAGYGALSVDHLEYLDPAAVPALAAAGTAAVLLPGAYYTLGQTQPPPVQALRQHGVVMAVATDCNPGTSPLVSPLMAMNMACTQFGLTPEEALAGMTRCAAAALGLQGRLGEIAEGCLAELAVWDVSHPAELSYWIGAGLRAERIIPQ